jgi:hypothetical protein
VAHVYFAHNDSKISPAEYGDLLTIFRCKTEL